MIMLERNSSAVADRVCDWLASGFDAPSASGNGSPAA